MCHEATLNLLLSVATNDVASDMYTHGCYLGQQTRTEKILMYQLINHKTIL
jgi:hypothetical protein